MTKIQLALEISKMTDFSETFLMNQTEEELQVTYNMLKKRNLG
jgi:hypothetical protein